jgi:hypothetical protein
MASTHTRSTLIRSRMANKIKADPNADVTEDRRLYREARLEEHITAFVDAEPPLTDAQRLRLAHILAGRPLDPGPLLTNTQGEKPRRHHADASDPSARR